MSIAAYRGEDCSLLHPPLLFPAPSFYASLVWTGYWNRLIERMLFRIQKRERFCSISKTRDA